MSETSQPPIEQQTQAFEQMRSKLGDKGMSLLGGQLQTWAELNGRQIESPLRTALAQGDTRLPEGTLLHGMGMYGFSSDGLSGSVNEDTISAKVTRFVYALGTGTVFYPDITTDKNDAKIIEQQLEGVSFSVPDKVNPVRALNAARSIEITEAEATEGSAQQVMPGVILGFDPTRTFWHQAPSETRPVLVIDIAQTE